MIVPIKLCNGQTEPPMRAHEGDAGYDLTSLESFELKPLERKLAKTGVKLAIPINHYGRIAPRSGLALKYGIDVMAGVIDSSYRGEVGVVLINLSDKSVFFEKGEKIAQLIIENCSPVEWLKTDDLESTARNDDGYGSSGRKHIPTLADVRCIDNISSLGSPALEDEQSNNIQ